MEAFDWVSTGSITKFNRAVKFLKDNKQEVTEEAIKTLYLKYGGLIIGDPSTQLGVDDGDVTFAVLPEAEKEAIIASQGKKKGKK